MSIIETELNLSDAFMKKMYISTKILFTPIIHRVIALNITLGYSVKYLTHIIICESVPGVMLYAKDFPYFEQKGNSKSR